MQSKIFCGNPTLQYEAHQEEILQAIREVCSSSFHVLGPKLEQFEAEFAAYNRSNHAVGVGSGTDALILALRAFDVGPGDEVITVSHTALATAAAIAMVGATPVLVDIEQDYYTLDPSKIEAAITPATKAIIPVHLYGHPCDMDPIMEIARRHQLNVIEDCAQAHGATYDGRVVGSIGHAGCFSFYPTKNLGAIGDGGAVITQDQNIADRIKRNRQYGWDKQRVSQEVSGVSRLDELQAAILSVKLKYLDEANRQRRELASYYTNLLTGQPIITPRERANARHVYHLYVVRCEDRDVLKSKLNDVGIIAGIHYAQPVHHHPSYQNRIKVSSDGLHVTERSVRSILSLPIYPGLNSEILQSATAEVF